MKKKKTLGAYFVGSFYMPIILSVLLVGIGAITLTGISSYRYASTKVAETAIQNSQSIEINMEMVDSDFRSTAYNTGLQKAMASYLNGDYAHVNDARIEVNKIITELTLFFSQVNNVAVYSTDGTLIGSRYEMSHQNAQEMPWFKTIGANARNTLWLTEPSQDSYSSGEDSYGCLVVTRVLARSNTEDVSLGVPLGFLVMEYDFEDVSKLLLSEESYHTYLLNESGIVMASSDPRATGSGAPKLLDAATRASVEKYGGRLVMMASDNVKTVNAQWTCVCTVPMYIVMQNVLSAVALCTVLAAIVLMVAWFVARRNARSIVAVFEHLDRSFTLIEQGQWCEVTVPESDILEINQITRKFEHMANRLYDLIEELLEAEMRKQQLLVSCKEAELQSLQMQINPHFLYNTLDTINWIALQHGEKDISSMVVTLGKLFRLNTAASPKEVTVGQEVERVELYMSLQQRRFGRRLCYSIRVDKAALQHKMPGFLVQPLVENAILHGIAPHSKRGDIGIVIDADEERIYISVTDNGLGMPPQTLDELRQIWKLLQYNCLLESEDNRYVGMRNIMKRLCLLYGDRASFTIESSVRGTRVEVSYPIPL